MSAKKNHHLAKILRNTTEDIVLEDNEFFVKIAENTWVQSERRSIGRGTFGKVYAAKNKITLRKKGILEAPIDNVVKMLSYASNSKGIIEESKREIIERSKKEVDYLNGHGVQAQLVECSYAAFIVMDNCGVSLKRLIPFPADTPFAKRVVFAKGILNEASLLIKNDVVHCDLKLENICCRQLKNGAWQFFFIDFGSAIEAGTKRDSWAGTHVYIAPEIFAEEGGNSFSSDLYALVPILGGIFGVKDIFKFKKLAYLQAYKKEYCSLLLEYYRCSTVGECFDRKWAKKMAIAKGCEAASKKPFNLEGLCEGKGIGGFEKDLLQLLKESSAFDPDARPALDFALKFFGHIPYRMKDFATFANDYEKLNQLKQEYARLSEQRGLPASGQLSACNVPAQSTPSYYTALEKITESNGSVAEIESQFPNLQGDIEQLEKMLQEMQRMAPKAQNTESVRVVVGQATFFNARKNQLRPNRPCEVGSTLSARL